MSTNDNDDKQTIEKSCDIDVRRRRGRSETEQSLSSRFGTHFRLFRYDDLATNNTRKPQRDIEYYLWLWSGCGLTVKLLATCYTFDRSLFPIIITTTTTNRYGKQLKIVFRTSCLPLANTFASSSSCDCFVAKHNLMLFVFDAKIERKEEEEERTEFLQMDHLEKQQ